MPSLSPNPNAPSATRPGDISSDPVHGNGEDGFWRQKIISADQAIGKLRPGMSIFIGTGVAEPRSLLKSLMTPAAAHLEDLELIQLVSFGEAIPLKELRAQKYRLKTFFAGWVAANAITEGQVDLIPSRFAKIPQLIESGQIIVNAAFVQITPPDRSGNCSLGVAVDAARQAMDKATLVIGEINPRIPRTFGDTFVHVSEFDFLVRSTEAPIFFDRWPVDIEYHNLAAQIAPLIDDGSCIAFSIGPLYEALSAQLLDKRHLGVHSPYFTDALMDLVRAGAITNRFKESFRGKSLASYALGTPELMQWLDRNPQVEFQGIDKVFDPRQIGRNPKFMAVLPAHKVDLAGSIAMPIGEGNIATVSAEVLDFINGAELSAGGHLIIALPSRSAEGQPNVVVSAEAYSNRLNLQESIDMVATEYGVARLKGYTLRERAQLLIDIAHPDDRPGLIQAAKAAHILYHDQIIMPGAARLYPSDISFAKTFKGGIDIRFRPIKPSDEEEMRRLFYRFSNESVYARYFGHLRSMPHTKIQAYVNVDWRHTMSIVGLTDEPDPSRIIAEARYIISGATSYAEIVFVVDEAYQGLGIGTYLYEILIEIARQRGLKGFTADVLFSNIGMMKVFRKGPLPVLAKLEEGIYHLTIPLET
jgi:acyl-CoA hydrolase/GNAT superfamily N-acetyltransferase